ncbi:MAG TPA: hypothetical protein V6C52_14200 [Coleofasciculaceae cyanobacterium]|jgi:hypothetical protein
MLSGVSNRLHFGSMRIYESPETIRLRIKADDSGDIFLARDKNPVYTSGIVKQHSNTAAFKKLMQLYKADVAHPEICRIAEQLLDGAHLQPTEFHNEPPCRSSQRPENTKSAAFQAKRKLFLDLLPKDIYLEGGSQDELGLYVTK